MTGSDLRESAVTERLRSLGIAVAIGHDAANVGDAAAGHPLDRGGRRPTPRWPRPAAGAFPSCSRAETLAAIAARKRCIAVAGTHGKTTTASMLALILVEAGLHPSFLIGGDVNEIGTNAVWDAGEWIVVEADESDGTFLHLVPDIAVVTNVEADHLDHYGSFDAVRTAFAEFLASAGHRVVGGDDAEARAIGRAVGADLVGLGEEADLSPWWRWPRGAARSPSTCSAPTGRWWPTWPWPCPACTTPRTPRWRRWPPWPPGPTAEAAARALARFGGVARRFEFRGELDGVTYVDDYAHLPTEVAAALAAARNGSWGRVVAVFQPHRYSRTAEVAEAFGGAFDDADVVVVTDVYGAGEAPVPGVSGRLVAEAVAPGPSRRRAPLRGRPDRPGGRGGRPAATRATCA